MNSLKKTKRQAQELFFLISCTCGLRQDRATLPHMRSYQDRATFAFETALPSLSAAGRASLAASQLSALGKRGAGP